MRLNEKQRNFLISILEKVSVYTITIVIVGKIVNKEITPIQIIISIIGIVICVILGLFFAKEK